jgi:tellurite resistance protein TerC
MEVAIWIGFLLLIMGFLALDLGVFNKEDHVIGFREALKWTVVWICVSMCFAGGVWFLYYNQIAGFGTGEFHEKTGQDALTNFVSGYVVEYSLSVDNIFVIALIVQAFKVPREFQHRVLFWGILGALLLRGAMIGAGAVLIHKFAWMMYVFGAILLLTAARMALAKDEEIDVERSWVARTARKFYPLAPTFDGRRFFTTLPDGRRAMTPLMLVLVLVESTDVLFAVDSIPAVFAVTQDPFLVFTSNVFAVLGLRSLYFALAGALHKFHYLKPALIVLLAFIGIKMVLAHHVKIPPTASLAIIAAILACGMVASLLHMKEGPSPEARALGDDDLPPPPGA